MNEVVFFFGGYLAKQSDIDKWLRTARRQKPAVKFIGFPWPSGAVSSDGHKARKPCDKPGCRSDGSSLPLLALLRLR
jgi:hypothetical protein